MMENGPSAVSTTWTRWPRGRAPIVSVILVICGVHLVYLAYSSKAFHGAPSIMHASDISQRGSNNRTAATRIVTSNSWGNSAMSGRTTPSQSMITNSTLTLNVATDRSRTNISPRTINLLKSFRIFTTMTTKVLPAKSSHSRPTATVTSTKHQTSANRSGHPKTYKVYVAGRGGRIGNQMFEYAAGYGIARMNKRSAVTHNTKFNTLWDIFANISLPRSQPLPSMHTMSEASHATYDPKYEKLPDSNVNLWGYFQSWKYFQKYERDLRTEFIFKETILSKAKKYLVHITQMNKGNSSYENITFIGVHVRRGDKLRSRRYRVASKSYIVRAMNDFRRNFTRVHFVVCSDDIPWCMQNLGQQKNVSFSKSRSPIIDFVMLSLCNHTLSTVGTFSWWVGWLAGGVTTYYALFVNTSTTLYSGVKSTDHFLPNWIPISD